MCAAPGSRRPSSKARSGPRADGRRQPGQRPPRPRRPPGGVLAQGANFLWPRCRARTSPAPSRRWPTSPAPRCKAPTLARRASRARCCAMPSSGREPAKAMLHGADMTGAKLQGSDLAAPTCGARAAGAEAAAYSIWRRSSCARLEERSRRAGSLAGRIDRGRTFRPAGRRGWGSLAGQNAALGHRVDPQGWQGWPGRARRGRGRGLQGRLTDYLARLMCRPR